MEHFDVEADLIVVAKSIAGGLPLSGVVGRASIMDDPHAGAIGGTFIGNPVALAAALAVLDVFEDEGLVERAVIVGDAIRARMLEWQARWPQVGDVRGLGAMLAIEFVRDAESKEPAPELAEAVIDEALRRGLILLRAGVYGNCIRVLCPLSISDGELDEGLEVWEGGARPPCSTSARRARSAKTSHMSTCNSCGANLPDDARFCPSCGTEQDTPAPAAEERKLATVLFADLVSSTARAHGEDPSVSALASIASTPPWPRRSSAPAATWRSSPAIR